MAKLQMMDGGSSWNPQEEPAQSNSATESDLTELIAVGYTSKLFHGYRKILGNLISIYELQAIPGWDLLLSGAIAYNGCSARTHQRKPAETTQHGDHHIILRYSRVMEQSKGYHEKMAQAAFMPAIRKSVLAINTGIKICNTDWCFLKPVSHCSIRLGASIFILFILWK